MYTELEMINKKEKMFKQVNLFIKLGQMKLARAITKNIIALDEKRIHQLSICCPICAATNFSSSIFSLLNSAFIFPL